MRTFISYSNLEEYMLIFKSRDRPVLAKTRTKVNQFQAVNGLVDQLSLKAKNSIEKLLF